MSCPQVDRLSITPSLKVSFSLGFGVGRRFQMAVTGRVDRAVTRPAPHRSGRAQFTHPAPQWSRFAARCKTPRLSRSLSVSVKLSRFTEPLSARRVSRQQSRPPASPSLHRVRSTCAFPGFTATMAHSDSRASSCLTLFHRQAVPPGCSQFRSSRAPRHRTRRPGEFGFGFSSIQRRSIHGGRSRASQVPGQPQCQHALLSDPGGTKCARLLRHACTAFRSLKDVGSHH